MQLQGRGLHRATGLHRAPQGPRKPKICWYVFCIFGKILRFLVKIICFLSFSNKNHAESFRNFVKNLILNPKHTKLDQKSWFGHVRTCQDLSRRTSTYCKPAEILQSFQKLHLSFFLTKFIMFYKIMCFTKQIYHVCKNLCFTKQTYHLLKNHMFY